MHLRGPITSYWLKERSRAKTGRRERAKTALLKMTFGLQRRKKVDRGRESDSEKQTAREQGTRFGKHGAHREGEFEEKTSDGDDS